MSGNLTYEANIPPQGSAPVYRRLFRGYGPLALLALALMLMAALVPTLSTEAPAESNTTDATESGLVIVSLPAEVR
ncbi:hypothetical protein [Actinospongicola halichondriae]|uniref:hypothetical protein n=1 Tax=Actinospongicola halichondriae TaxID=3236844 RepID=UPI003D482E84